jgi:hypothetical protein
MQPIMSLGCFSCRVDLPTSNSVLHSEKYKVNEIFFPLHIQKKKTTPTSSFSTCIEADFSCIYTLWSIHNWTSSSRARTRFQYPTYLRLFRPALFASGFSGCLSGVSSMLLPTTLSQEQKVNFNTLTKNRGVIEACGYHYWKGFAWSCTCVFEPCLRSSKTSHSTRLKGTGTVLYLSS